MIAKEVEIILARQWASYLAMPIFIVDPQGTLIYYNESAEHILGRRFEETGEMPVAEWATLFKASDEAGKPLDSDTLPLVIALAERRPARRDFWIRGLDDVLRHIEVSAFPLIGLGQRHLGAMAIVWEVSA
ncbi:MAG: PAS domain-containing protein [Chloroflexi bacterium]|nr:PAS domain-containing protein [Chloroflexota bacterium]